VTRLAGVYRRSPDRFSEREIATYLVEAGAEDLTDRVARER